MSQRLRALELARKARENLLGFGSADLNELALLVLNLLGTAAGGTAGTTRPERARIEAETRCSCRDDLTDPNRKRTCERHGIEPWLRVRWPFGT